jgi:hypothetical protein
MSHECGNGPCVTSAPKSTSRSRNFVGLLLTSRELQPPK